MLIHDVIKIQYSRQGYLPNYPPHLISDEEMCDAFLKFDDIDSFEEDTGLSYFKDNYPFLFDEDEKFDVINPRTRELYPWGIDVLTKEPYTYKHFYYELVEYISNELKKFKNSLDDNKQLPNWIYAYMIGSVISVNSNKEDIHDLLVYLDVDNLDDEFLKDASRLCLVISKSWISRTPDNTRPPGMFGEPHVLKQLKLAELSLIQQVI